MIGDDVTRLYKRLEQAFEAVSQEAVDIQTDFSERLSLIEAVFGVKPSFVAFIDARKRAGAFRRVAEGIPDGCAHGFVEGDVHHRYRPFAIGDPGLRGVAERRSPYVQKVFWVTRNTDLADVYRRGEQARVSDDRLLGYPACCARWHYDSFIARGLEAFCAVAEADRSAEMREYLQEIWQPLSGFYLPRPLFLAAILRSNWRYPFIAHVACPDCLDSPEGPSASLNARRSELGSMLDPRMHRDLVAWATRQEPRWRGAVSDRAAVIRQHARENAVTVRGEEVYARHARHLGKALGL